MKSILLHFASHEQTPACCSLKETRDRILYSSIARCRPRSLCDIQSSGVPHNDHMVTT